MKTNDAKTAIIAALTQGRRLSLFNAEEFGTSQMHTQFAKIRRDVEDGRLPSWKMCSDWRENENGVRYKVYWFERVRNFDCVGR